MKSKSLLVPALLAGLTASVLWAQEPPRQPGRRGEGDLGLQPAPGKARPGGPPGKGPESPSGEPASGRRGSGFEPRGRQGDFEPGALSPRGRQRGMPLGPGLGPSPFEPLEEVDPEMFKLVSEDNQLERECFALARQFQQAKSQEREKLRTQLEVQVNKHFDVRQQRRELSLKRLEEELKRLREAIEARTKAREEIVRKRMTELVGDERDLEF
jgi:hypothetical protein